MAVYQVGEKFRVMCRRNAQNKTIRKWYAVYKCGCGKNFVSRCEDIKDVGAQSCGCQRAAAVVKAATGSKHNVKHGRTKTREYKIWSMIKERCLKPSHKSYKDYGGRGITVCNEWLDSFEAFFDAMGLCPDGMSIERIDTNGPYEKANCKWATRVEQGRNKRNNVIVEIDGEVKLAVDWAQTEGAAGIGTIYNRVRSGFTGRDAIQSGRRSRRV
jgi:hypothetical protein